MSKTMRVRVKEKMRGWYCGKLYYGRDIESGKMKGDEFTIREREHSTQTDDDGNPVIITVEQQFSSNWMEKVEKIHDAEFEEIPDDADLNDAPDEDDVITGRHPSEMTVKELKEELEKAEIEIPSGANKKQLVDLLEAYMGDQS